MDPNSPTTVVVDPDLEPSMRNTKTVNISFAKRSAFTSDIHCSHPYIPHCTALRLQPS